MRFIVLSLVLTSLVPAGAMAASHSASAIHRNQGAASATALAQEMISALKAQDRVQVQGSTAGQGMAAASYLLQYQKDAREYVTLAGGPIAKARVGKRPIAGVRSIKIGKKFWTSTDGIHWAHGKLPQPPTVMDVLSLNVANAPCCESTARSQVRLTAAGSRQLGGKTVDVLDFHLTSQGRSASGAVLIDRQSHLPLQYSVTNKSPLLSKGRYTVSYGGTFDISAPK